MFKKHIKRLRNEAKMTQSQLANRLGIPKSTVNSWEQGYSHPRFLQIKPLCRILDIEIEELFDYDE